MATLVGDDATRATTGGVTAGYLGFACGGYTAVASGTATTAYIRIQNVQLATACKICVYSAAGSLLGTATISSLATGWVSAALDSGIAITSGTRYELGYVTAGGQMVIYADGTPWNLAEDDSGSYASPPSTITPRADGSGDTNYGKPSIYLDGSTGGGATLASRLSLLGVGV